MEQFDVSSSLNKGGSFGPNLAVIGVGGAGQNAVDNMLRLGLDGVNFAVCNTDAQALNQSLCPEDRRVCIGYNVTKGLGAGSSPDVGKSAAEESLEEVMSKIDGAHMLFITAGMGGGTGTGAGPVIAKAAKERGILTIGVVTKPFQFEGPQRLRSAEHGISVMKECVDTLIVIPNQNLFRLATDSTTFAQAFAMADEVLYSAVRTFTDLMIKPGLVNLDFADICTVMRNVMCKAMIGTGDASGENRAIEAAKKAIACPLIEDVDLSKARSILIHIAGGFDMTLYEVDEAAGCIKQEVDQNANIIFGSTFDEKLQGVLRVSVVATGIEYDSSAFSVVSSDSISAKADESSLEASSNYEYIGSRHMNASFDEQHFSSFAAREDSNEYGSSEIAQDGCSGDPVQENFFDIRGAAAEPGPRFSMLKKIASLGRAQIFKKTAQHNAGSSYASPPASAYHPKQSNVHQIKEMGIEPHPQDASNDEVNLIPAFLRQDKKRRN